jgi:hypothetical protein
MDLRLQKTINALNGSEQFFVSPGPVKGLMVVAEGTNDTGQTGTNADVGSIIVQRNGRQTHNLNFQRFAEIGDIRSGTNLFSSTEAGAFLASCYIPFSEIGFTNIFDLVSDDELNVQFQPASSVSTVFTALTVKVYAQYAPGIVEGYTYQMVSNDKVYSADVTDDLTNLSPTNVTALYIKDADGVLSTVQVDQDGNSILGNIDFDAVKAATLYNNQLEDGSFAVAQVLCMTPGVLGTVPSRNTQLRLSTSGISGSSTVNVAVCSMQTS